MSFWKKLKKIISRKPLSEIELVEAALARYYHQLDTIEKKWRRAGAVCCPGCFSYEYVWLASKIDRVETWLKILKKRKNKQ